MKDRSDMPEEIRTLQEQGSDRVYACMTPAERIGIMWQLALDAWALKGNR